LLAINGGTFLAAEAGSFEVRTDTTEISFLMSPLFSVVFEDFSSIPSGIFRSPSSAKENPRANGAPVLVGAEPVRD
jgi:hypothetical protein